MVMSTVISNLRANKWYPLQNGRPLYPSPQSVLKEAVGADEARFMAETVTISHIRASCIMPLDVPFYHLLANEPWGMSYKTAHWRMLIVSTIDTNRWIELAQASGAIAWLKNHNMSCTYIWEPPVRDEHGLKIRPNNPMGINSSVGMRSHKGVQKKPYNKDQLLADCREGLLTHAQIGEKHGLSRITVLKIANENGITRTKRNSDYGSSYA